MNLREFLELFPAPGVKKQLQKFARRPDIKALIAVYKPDIGLSPVAYTEIPDHWPDNARYWWVKPSTAHSRTRHALSLVEAGETVKTAAAKAGVSTVAVYRAMKRRQGKPVCHCCGQVIRTEFTTPLPPAGDA